MKYIKGHKRKLFLLNRDTQEYEPVVCLTSTDYSQVLEMIEKNNVCEQSEQPRSISRSVSFSGEVATNETGKSIDDLYQEQELSRSSISKWRLCGGLTDYEFDAYLTDASDSYGDGDATFSGSLTIVGKPSDIWIEFADPIVVSIFEDANLVTFVDNKAKLIDLQKIITLEDAFPNDSRRSQVESFDEFKYFESIKYINPAEFEGMSALESIILPKSTVNIGTEAFLGATSLTSFTILATIPPIIGDEVFSGTSNLTIYVPSQSVSAYKSAWSEYSSEISPII